MACHLADLLSPWHLMLPSRRQSSVLRRIALFQTWTSSPSKSCICLMETEHTSENNIGSLVGVNDDKSGDIVLNFSEFHQFYTWMYVSYLCYIISSS
ncbi:hypothetical protein QL285_084268 [Trifolium repens]|nr:hypothetical protein QL285_084268 [Trifolium repens]